MNMHKGDCNMMIFIIGLLTIMGLIPIIVKLAEAEKEFSELVDREHEKALQGIARYNDMKKSVRKD